MAWRLYYTLEEAAEKLGREFNDTYTANDLYTLCGYWFS